MKLTIRDFLWLVLLLASLTAWGVQHFQGSRQVGRRFLFRGYQEGPSNASLRRQAALQRYATFTDQQLDDELAVLPANNEKRRDFEPCLTEMVRRRLADRLQKHFDAVLASGSSKFPYHYDLELLTALRRAQGQPDPLLIETSLSSSSGLRTSAPVISVSITNVDVGKQPVTFKYGGDYRGGRQERWRFELTDEQGRTVPDCSLLAYGGGGICQIFPMKFGQTDRGPTEFDLREYVRPPGSGKYNLHVLYHNGHSIAGESDVTGLVVAHSAPIPIIIHRRDSLAFQGLQSGNQMLAAILAACGVMLATSWLSRRPQVDAELLDREKMPALRGLSISRRDRRWCLLLLFVAAGLWIDYQLHALGSTRVPRAAEVPWSLSVDEASPAARR